MQYRQERRGSCPSPQSHTHLPELPSRNVVVTPSPHVSYFLLDPLLAALGVSGGNLRLKTGDCQYHSGQCVCVLLCWKGVHTLNSSRTTASQNVCGDRTCSCCYWIWPCVLQRKKCKCQDLSNCEEREKQPATRSPRPAPPK